MLVKTIDGTEAAGLALVLRVMAHAETTPRGPWTACLAQGAVTDGSGAVWFPEGDSVARIVGLPCACGHSELTKYSDGVELSRSIAPTS